MPLVRVLSRRTVSSFQAGWVLRRCYILGHLQGYQGLDDFEPLFLDMLSEDLLARSDMEDARGRLYDLVSSNNKLWLRGKIWRLCAE